MFSSAYSSCTFWTPALCRRHPGSLCHFDRLLHSSSLPSFPAQAALNAHVVIFLLAACSTRGPHCKEAERWFELKLSWQRQWLGQKDEGRKKTSTNSASQGLLRSVTSCGLCPLLQTPTSVLCQPVNCEPQGVLTFLVWSKNQDCLCYCYHIT